MVHCPGCNRTQPERGPNAIYWCDRCKCQFDSDPDEGGTHSDFNPAVRLEREERRQQQTKQRRPR